MEKEMNRKLKVLDLFSGVGGFSLGMEATNSYETVAFCEIDPYCKQVLNNHWPEVPIFNDIKKLTSTHIYSGENYLQEGCLEPDGKPETEVWYDQIDVIVGGFPCLGHSVAGKKKGLKNGQSSLWKEYLRIIKEIQPRYVIIENSPNLRNTGLGEVLKDLQSIFYMGLGNVVSVTSIGGVHRRERLFLIAWPAHTNTNPVRLQQALAEAQIEQVGRTKRRFGDGSKWQDKPELRRVDDDVPTEPYEYRGDGGITRERYRLIAEKIGRMQQKREKLRKERIKQMGNAVCPDVVEMIGRAIINYEKDSK